MPEISTKGRALPESPIRKLVPFADIARSKGRHIFHLNIGQPDIKTPEQAMQTLRESKIEVIEYSHSAGIESYRKKLAGYYNQFDMDVNYEQIMITTGGSEALLFALISCLDPGDEIIIPEPFYANYNGFSTLADVVVKPITTSIENGYALPPMEEFEKVITSKTKAILICNPGNPTGTLYSKENLQKLAAIVKKHDLFLIADEVYREFCYEGEHFSVMNMVGIDDNVILTDSISKRYSACGARVGALVTKNKEVFNTALKLGQARLSPPTLGQIIGEAAIDTPKSYFDEVFEEYKKRRDVVIEALQDMDGVVCPTPGGAFYTMAKFPVDDTEKFCKWLLEDFELDGNTLMMAPGNGFYSSKHLGNQEARIAYVLNISDLRKAMDCLKEALKVYPGRTN